MDAVEASFMEFGSCLYCINGFLAVAISAMLPSPHIDKFPGLAFLASDIPQWMA